MADDWDETQLLGNAGSKGCRSAASFTEEQLSVLSSSFMLPKHNAKAVNDMLGALSFQAGPRVDGKDTSTSPVPRQSTSPLSRGQSHSSGLHDEGAGSLRRNTTPSSLKASQPRLPRSNVRMHEQEAHDLAGIVQTASACLNQQQPATTHADFVDERAPSMPDAFRAAKNGHARQTGLSADGSAAKRAQVDASAASKRPQLVNRTYTTMGRMTAAVLCSSRPILRASNSVPMPPDEQGPSYSGDSTRHSHKSPCPPTGPPTASPRMSQPGATRVTSDGAAARTTRGMSDGTMPTDQNGSTSALSTSTRGRVTLTASLSLPNITRSTHRLNPFTSPLGAVNENVETAATASSERAYLSSQRFSQNGSKGVTLSGGSENSDASPFLSAGRGQDRRTDVQPRPQSVAGGSITPRLSNNNTVWSCQTDTLQGLVLLPPRPRFSDMGGLESGRAYSSSYRQMPSSEMNPHRLSLAGRLSQQTSLQLRPSLNSNGGLSRLNQGTAAVGASVVVGV